MKPILFKKTTRKTGQNYGHTGQQTKLFVTGYNDQKPFTKLGEGSQHIKEVTTAAADKADGQLQSLFRIFPSANHPV